MKTILERIQSGEVLISDGAIGTFLQAMGLKPGECPESWCVTHPNEVKSIAESYITAGSDIVLTNSFGGSYFKLKEFGLADKVQEFNKAAVTLAKQAAEGKGYVAASVGPTGQIVEDEGGDVTEEQLYDAYKDQMIAIEAGGADAVCIETMSSVTEACQAIKAAKDNTSLLVICTMTYEPGARGFRTMMGVTPERAAQETIEAGADIIGANCGNGIENMVQITKQLRAAAPDCPILIHANAGMPVLENGKAVFKATPEDMAAVVPELIAAGANIIGGCCGTTPKHIAAIASAAK